MKFPKIDPASLAKPGSPSENDVSFGSPSENDVSAGSPSENDVSAGGLSEGRAPKADTFPGKVAGIIA